MSKVAEPDPMDDLHLIDVVASLGEWLIRDAGIPAPPSPEVAENLLQEKLKALGVTANEQKHIVFGLAWGLHIQCEHIGEVASYTADAFEGQDLDAAQHFRLKMLTMFAGVQGALEAYLFNVAAYREMADENTPQ